MAHGEGFPSQSEEKLGGKRRGTVGQLVLGPCSEDALRPMQVPFELYAIMQDSRSGVIGERFGLTFVPQMLDPSDEGHIEINGVTEARAAMV